MTAKEKAKELEDKIQQEIWILQMLDYVTSSTTDDLDRMRKELKEVKQEIINYENKAETSNTEILRIEDTGSLTMATVNPKAKLYVKSKL